MTLFTTLLSSSATQLKEGSTTEEDGGLVTATTPATLSSTSIPTVIQLYTSKALNMMPGIHDLNDDSPETGGLDKSGSASNLQKLDVADDEGLLEGQNGSHLSSYEVLSYQAIQVSATPLSSSSSSSSTTAETLLFGSKRKFATPFHKQLQVLEPNLGVWNCRCPSYNDVNNNTSSSSSNNNHHNNKTLVVDQLLKVPLEELGLEGEGEGGGGDRHRSPPGFMLTVDLSDPLEVEPTISTLQQVLVRHLIESAEMYTTKPSPLSDSSDPVDGNNSSSTTTTSAATTTAATTSLEQLRQVQFGLASHDLGTIKETTTQESDALVKIPLIICAIVPPSSTIQDYKSKQAQSLLFYHLRKYCASLQASLCLCRTHKTILSPSVDSPKTSKSGGPNKKKKKNRQKRNSNATSEAEDAKEQEANASLTPQEMAYALRQIVLGKDMEDSTKMKFSSSTAAADEDDETATANKEEKDGDDGVEDKDGDPAQDGNEDVEEDMGISAMYRPGPSMQEDLIETVCLRNAHCSGEWDASTDSIWLALPSFGGGENSSKSRQESLLDKMKQSRGDDEWLFQLRDSVSALMSTSSSSSSTTALGEKSASTSASTSTSTKSTSSKVSSTASASSSGGGGVTLEDFMNSSTPAPSIKSKSSSSSTKASKKSAMKKSASAKKKTTPAADGPDVSSFFEDLLKK
mmetsp:Transcript_23169/g.35733  ORF Transcript_23169/g.35733 Transcript_23169/m.35733 type:complete len:687 (+) Transcript_23169:799-2859(+)